MNFLNNLFWMSVLLLIFLFNNTVYCQSDLAFSKSGNMLNFHNISIQQEAGIVIGRVIDRQTNRSLPGANIIIQGTNIGTATDGNGEYRLQTIPPGTYRIEARFVGYRQQTREIEISAREEITVDFELEAVAIDFDEIVVTGTIVGTERRALGTAVSTLNEAEIQRINPLTINDLFERGHVPGVISLDRGIDSDFNQMITIRGSNISLRAMMNDVKVLIDGVEVNVRFLSNISARDIERVEVIRGPQASTIYGAEGSGGVIQLFTRKGQYAERDRISIGTRQGITNSKYIDSNVWTRDFDATLSGGLVGGSYSIGGSIHHQDGYVPNYDRDLKRFSFGFSRRFQEILRLDFLARYNESKIGNPGSAAILMGLYKENRLPDWYGTIDYNDYFTMRAIAIGLNISFMPYSWWEHNLVLGQDYNRNRTYSIPDTPDNTIHRGTIFELTRPTLRYTSNVSVPRIGFTKMNILVGFEYVEPYWIQNFQSWEDKGEPYAAKTGGFIWEENMITKGYYGQIQLGLGDKFFITTGLRTDYNTNFGENFGKYSTNPRISVTYLIEPSPGWVIKPRGSWGTGIVAPTVLMVAGRTPHVRANPDIEPQTSVGWELGADNYLFDGRLHFEFTYYDQLTDNVIVVDYIEFPFPWRYANVGELSNKGWEFHAKYVSYPLELSGTLSTNNNKFVSIPEELTSSQTIGKPLVSPPLPTISSNVSVVYGFDQLLNLRAVRSLMLGVNVNYIGKRWTDDFGARLDAMSEGTYTGRPADYHRWWDGFTKTDVFINSRVGRNINFNITVQNVFNSFEASYPYYVVPGRKIFIDLGLEI